MSSFCELSLIYKTATASREPAARTRSTAREHLPALRVRLLRTHVKALLLTNEYPPSTYGGAGVHVEYLSRELAKLMPVEVRCFGDQKVRSGNLTVRGFQLEMTGWNCPKELRSTLGAVQRCIDFNA